MRSRPRGGRALTTPPPFGALPVRPREVTPRAALTPAPCFPAPPPAPHVAAAPPRSRRPRLQRSGGPARPRPPARGGARGVRGSARRCWCRWQRRGAGGDESRPPRSRDERAKSPVHIDDHSVFKPQRFYTKEKHRFLRAGGPVQQGFTSQGPGAVGAGQRPGLRGARADDARRRWSPAGRRQWGASRPGSGPPPPVAARAVGAGDAPPRTATTAGLPANAPGKGSGLGCSGGRSLGSTQRHTGAPSTIGSNTEPKGGHFSLARDGQTRNPALRVRGIRPAPPSAGAAGTPGRTLERIVPVTAAG